MKILLVAATRAEIEPFLLSRTSNASSTIASEHSIDILITGVGMVATAFVLGGHLAVNTYDLAINAGIAGCFDFSIALGEVVLVTEDLFAEQGAEDGDEFISLKELGLGDSLQLAASSFQQTAKPHFRNLNLKTLDQLRQVKAITVNKVHGNELTISKTLSRFNAQIESMEGAAFFYGCNQSNTPCLQLRSVSNYVERRNKEKWNIGLAVKNLNEQLVNLLIS